MTLGELVRVTRQRTVLGVGEAAALCKCSSAHLSEIERGKARPSPALLERMIKVYDMRAEEPDRLRVMLAMSHIPPSLRKRVEVLPRGKTSEVARAAEVWVHREGGLSEKMARLLRRTIMHIWGTTG